MPRRGLSEKCTLRPQKNRIFMQKQDSASSYLKYGLIEITMVVLGIFIALQMLFYS